MCRRVLSVEAYSPWDRRTDIARPQNRNRLHFPNSSMEPNMGNVKTDDKRPDATDQSAEGKLRGDALAGSERKRAVDHTKYDETRNPDKVVRVDNEEDSLYDDGLELDEDTPPLGTSGGVDQTR
jgi:hypothetical protein